MESEILFDPSLSSINDYPLDPFNINGIDLSPEQEPEKIYIQMNDNNFNEGKNEKEEIISCSNESKFTPEKESSQIIKFEIVNSNYLFQPKNPKNIMEENKKVNKFCVEQSDNKNEKTRKEKTDDIRKK